MTDTSTPARIGIALNGVRLVPDLSGALWWPERRTLVVADLHLEKGSSYDRHALPPYDSAATLRRLADVLARHAPETVICLGDTFHDRRAAERLPDVERQRLQAMAARHDWVWIAGNHDPAPPADWGGRVAEDLVMGPLLFRHAADPGQHAAGEVSGHYHPKASVRVRGRRVSARCFVGDGRRLVLPAFGAYTGGLDVRDPAIRGLFARGFRAHLLGRGAVHAYPGSALVG